MEEETIINWLGLGYEGFDPNIVAPASRNASVLSGFYLRRIEGFFNTSTPEGTASLKRWGAPGSILATNTRARQGGQVLQIELLMVADDALHLREMYQDLNFVLQATPVELSTDSYQTLKAVRSSTEIQEEVHSNLIRSVTFILEAQDEEAWVKWDGDY